MVQNLYKYLIQPSLDTLLSANVIGRQSARQDFFFFILEQIPFIRVIWSVSVLLFIQSVINGRVLLPSSSAQRTDRSDRTWWRLHRGRRKGGRGGLKFWHLWTPFMLSSLLTWEHPHLSGQSCLVLLLAVVMLDAWCSPDVSWNLLEAVLNLNTAIKRGAL